MRAFSSQYVHIASNLHLYILYFVKVDSFDDPLWRDRFLIQLDLTKSFDLTPNQSLSMFDRFARMI